LHSILGIRIPIDHNISAGINIIIGLM